MARNIYVQIALDLTSLLIAGIPILVFKFAVTPYKRGFYCDDESLKHPFHESTISTGVLVGVGLSLPVVVMVITEVIIYTMKEKRGMLPSPYTMGSVRIPSWVYYCYRHIGVFLFGAAVSQTTTDIAKYTVGRLRPHFFDVCKPDYTKFNCKDAQGLFQYITADVCTGTDDVKMKEMRLSFMSGHASLSMYCMFYLVLYIQARFHWKGQKVFKPILQVLVFFMAYGTCLSRISDYKHHWSDVLAGAIQGMAVSIIVALCISDLFPDFRKVRLTDIAGGVASIQSTVGRDYATLESATHASTASVNLGPQGDDSTIKNAYVHEMQNRPA